MIFNFNISTIFREQILVIFVSEFFWYYCDCEFLVFYFDFELMF